MIVIRDSKTFHFDFDWPKVAHENSKHKIEFIIKTAKRVNHINLFVTCCKD